MAGLKKGYHTGSIAVHEEAHIFAPSCVPLSIMLLLAAALKKVNMNSTTVLEINAYNLSMMAILVYTTNDQQAWQFIYRRTSSFTHKEDPLKENNYQVIEATFGLNNVLHMDIIKNLHLI
ncbi:hypothetical protein CMV_006711 [Castanea mollissima]|uniref:Uncharacterized protein n=1 Tax=Castanea mollissima TaxID=60419 RepID=A0A8J4VTC4_9ROSI|nr:hypothetical protein CMV_006711 [Castanea mollissima]